MDIKSKISLPIQWDFKNPQNQTNKNLHPLILETWDYLVINPTAYRALFIPALLSTIHTFCIKSLFPPLPICNVPDATETLVALPLHKQSHFFLAEHTLGTSNFIIYFWVEIFPGRCGPLPDLVSVLDFIQAVTTVLKNTSNGQSIMYQIFKNVSQLFCNFFVCQNRILEFGGEEQILCQGQSAICHTLKM